MPAESISTDKMNRTVVAFLDGRRLKGYVFNFSAVKDSFRLFLDEMAQQKAGTDVLIKNLKAVFFVKDFTGDPSYHAFLTAEPTQHGRRIEIQFKDGEKLSGTTNAYNAHKLGLIFRLSRGSAQQQHAGFRGQQECPPGQNVIAGV